MNWLDSQVAESLFVTTTTLAELKQKVGMYKYMKFKYSATITMLMAASMLSACAVHPQKETSSIKYHLHFYGAQDDLFPGEYLTAEVDIVEGDKSSLIRHNTHLNKFPLTYAIECNQAKTACKHAVVKTDIEFSTQKINNKTIKLSGVLRSEMGRKLTTSMTSSSLAGMTQVVSMSVDDYIEVINETKVDMPFEKTLQIGEKLELKGLAGAHVDIDFQQRSDI
jgi:hypothetical protein